MKGLLVLVILGFLWIMGCSNTGTGPQNTNNEGNGTLKLYLIDSPANLDSVVIWVRKVEVHKAGSDTTSGWITLNDSTRHFDLLQLRNGANAVLGDTTLAAGQYTQIRLILADSNYVVDTNGIKFPLTVPSGMQTGLKLTHQFTIEPNTLYELLLDFDAGRSIIKTGNGEYKLKPTVRVVAKITSGSISGIIMPLDADPLIQTVVNQDTVSTLTDTSGYFKLMGLPQGMYNINILPGNPLYTDSIITGINVFSGQDTDLDTITIN